MYAWRHWSISGEIMASAALLTFTVTENRKNKFLKRGHLEDLNTTNFTFLRLSTGYMEPARKPNQGWLYRVNLWVLKKPRIQSGCFMWDFFFSSASWAKVRAM